METNTLKTICHNLLLILEILIAGSAMVFLLLGLIFLISLDSYVSTFAANFVSAY